MFANPISDFNSVKAQYAKKFREMNIEIIMYMHNPQMSCGNVLEVVFSPSEQLTENATVIFMALTVV